MEFRQAMHIAIRHEFVHQVGERVAWSGGLPTTPHSTSVASARSTLPGTISMDKGRTVPACQANTPLHRHSGQPWRVQNRAVLTMNGPPARGGWADRFVKVANPSPTQNFGITGKNTGKTGNLASN
jgi:hypothetical protein